MGKLQLVWWGWRALRFGPVGPYPDGGAYSGRIYAWRFCLGPLEIRRWSDYVLRFGYRWPS